MNVGELLGVEYLYDPTGQVLQVMPDQSDVGQKDDAFDDDDSDDEGFEETLPWRIQW